MTRSIYSLSLDTITGSYEVSNNLIVSGTNLIVSGALSVTGSTYLKSTQVDGRLISNSGISGSLNKLTNGSNYLVAGTGTTVTTGSSGAVTVSVSSGGSSKAIAYNGYCTGSLLWNSTTWADFHTVPGNFTDTFQNGITRNNSTFTVASGGLYYFRSDFNHKNAYSYTSWRVSGSSGTIIQYTTLGGRWGSEGDGADLTGVFSLSAGESFKLQYAFKSSIAASTWSPSDPLDGESMRSGAICIYRVGTS